MAEKPTQIVIAGGSGGIGGALVRELLDQFPDAMISATHFRSEISVRDKRLA